MPRLKFKQQQDESLASLQKFAAASDEGSRELYKSASLRRLRRASGTEASTSLPDQSPAGAYTRPHFIST